MMCNTKRVLCCEVSIKFTNLIIAKENKCNFERLTLISIYKIYSILQKFNEE